MHPMTVLPIVLAVHLAFANLAQADQNLNCNAYASKAVKQQKDNVILACGYRGGAWSVNFGGHRRWCQRVDVQMTDLTREDNARVLALQECRKRIVACDKYALMAREYNQINRRMRCRFTGSAWSDNVNGHRKWCMTAHENARAIETMRRHGALTKCHKERWASGNFENANQKSQQYMNMLNNVMKTLNEMNQGITRNLN